MDIENDDQFENDDFSGFNSGDIDADFLADEYAPKDTNNETIEPIQKVARNEQNKSLLNFGSSLQIGDESPFSVLPKNQQSPKAVKNDNKVNNNPIDLKSFLQTPVGSVADLDDKSNTGGSRLLIKKTIDKAQDKSKPKVNIFPISLNESSSLHFDTSSQSQISNKNSNSNTTDSAVKVSQFTLPGIPVLSNDQNNNNNNNLPPLSDKNNLNSKQQTNVKIIKIASGNTASTAVNPSSNISQNTANNSETHKPNEEAKSANITFPVPTKNEGSSIKVSIKPRFSVKQKQQTQQVKQQISQTQQQASQQLQQQIPNQQQQQIQNQQQQMQNQQQIQNQPQQQIQIRQTQQQIQNQPQQQIQNQQQQMQNQQQIQNQPQQQIQIQQTQQQMQNQKVQQPMQNQQQLQNQPQQQIQIQQTQQQMQNQQQQMQNQNAQQTQNQTQEKQNQQQAQKRELAQTTQQPPKQQQIQTPQQAQQQIQSHQTDSQQQQQKNPNHQIQNIQQAQQQKNQSLIQQQTPVQQVQQQNQVLQQQIQSQQFQMPKHQQNQSNFSPTQNFAQSPPFINQSNGSQIIQQQHQSFPPPQPPFYNFHQIQQQQFNPLAEHVHFSFSAALDNSFSSIRRSVATELSKVLRSSSSSSFAASSYSSNSLAFDVDSFILNLNNDLVNALSFASPIDLQNHQSQPLQPSFNISLNPILNLGNYNTSDYDYKNGFSSVNVNMNLNSGETIRNGGYQTMLHSIQNEPILLRPLVNGINSAIDQEVKPLSTMMKDSLQEKNKIKAENVAILHDLLNQVESMRVTCKNFCDEIIRELEGEELMVASRRDFEASNYNKNANKLREMKLQFIELESKAKQQEIELKKNSELFDRLKQQIIFYIEKSNRKFNDKNARVKYDDQIRSPRSSNSFELEKILDEINEIENDIQNGGYGQICGEFENLYKSFQNDKNSMSDELLNIEYMNQQLLSRPKFNSINSNLNSYYYTQNFKQVQPQYNQNFNSNIGLNQNSSLNISKQNQGNVYSMNSQINKMTDANKRMNPYRKQRDVSLQSNLA